MVGGTATSIGLLDKHILRVTTAIAGEYWVNYSTARMLRSTASIILGRQPTRGNPL